MNLNGMMIAQHGGCLALVASVLVVAALRHNPRLFLKHFPEKVRAAQPPLSPGRRAGYLFGVPLFLLLVGVPILSTLMIAGGKGAPQDPLSLWVHAFLVGMTFNLVDWLVLDEAWLGVFKPLWALPPGVTVEDVTPFNHLQHFTDFLKGTIFFAVVAAIASAASIGGEVLGLFSGGEQ